MKKVSLLLCFALAGLSVSAQDSGNTTSGKPGRVATFESNGFWSNWFIGAGAGASMYFGPSDQHASFLDRMTVNPTFFVGKWFNPYMGARLAAQGGKIHSFDGSEAQTMYSMLHLNAHVDMMFNVTNYLMEYKSDRFYNFIPTIGMGYERRSEDDKFFKGRGFNGPTLNASLLNTFRISNRLSGYIEVGGYIVESRFDKGPQGKTHWNGIMNGNAGLMLKIGKTDFNEALVRDESLINDLNSQINRLRAENDGLKKQLPCPQVKPCPEVSNANPAPAPKTDEVYVPNVVFFRLNSAVIDNSQDISIYNTAEYLKANPNAKVKIVGYADKDTGTAAYNLKLSEKRAQNVAKVLVDKYKINSNRVQVEWKGSSEQPYKENAWNRVAIFFAD